VLLVVDPSRLPLLVEGEAWTHRPAPARRRSRATGRGRWPPAPGSGRREWARRSGPAWR